MKESQAMEFLASYQAGGGDLSALLANAQTLAATGKTPLGLNRWVATDKPTMADFNEDNRIVDEKLRQLSENMANWVYLDFSTLGLQNNATLNDVFSAMPIKSILNISSSAGTYPNLNPPGATGDGSFYFTRVSNGRAVVEYVSWNGAQRYHAAYSTSAQPWYKVSTTIAE